MVLSKACVECLEYGGIWAHLKLPQELYLKLTDVACDLFSTYWCCFFWMIDHLLACLCSPVSSVCLRCHLCEHLSLSVLPHISASRLISLTLCASNSNSVTPTSYTLAVVLYITCSRSFVLLYLLWISMFFRTVSYIFHIVPFRFLLLTQTLYHRTPCSPSMTPGCRWWTISTSKLSSTWHWPILCVMGSSTFSSYPG